MAFQVYLLIFSVLVFAHSLDANVDDSKCDCTDIPIKGSTFKSLNPGFVFGAATSSYQVEGAYDTDGKGPNIWDTFTHQFPDKIAGKTNGDVATNSYYLYKEDVRAAKMLGLDVYRFSISWSRILPKGKVSRGINYKGIEYYNNLIDELLANGIQPCVTLFHWDVPQALDDLYGGFLSPRIVEDFLGYADILFKHFGDRVPIWITVNEPYTSSSYGYGNAGVFAPGRCSFWNDIGCVGGDSGTEPYLVAHHQLLAHAAAVHLYWDKYKAKYNGKIGITLSSPWYLPFDAANDDGASKVALDFFFGWFMDPLTSGEYPASMRERVKDRLPTFTPAQKANLTGSYDILGLNYYNGQFTRFYPEGWEAPYPSYFTDSRINFTSKDIHGNYPGADPPYEGSWLYPYPTGLRNLLNHITTNYGNPKIYITENGICSSASIPIFETIFDTGRVDYINEHLCCIHSALEKGSDVSGYIIWSLLDNFEWNVGYTDRFGLFYVDFNHNYKRSPKYSAFWLQYVLGNDTSIPPTSLPLNQAENPIRLTTKNRKGSFY